MIKCHRLQWTSDLLWNCTKAFRGAPDLELTWIDGPREHFKGGQARLGWTSDALWVWAVVDDDFITTKATSDGQRLWMLGDVIEIFFRDLREPSYDEMHVDPLGHRFHLRFHDETCISRIRARQTGLRDFILPEPGFDALTRRSEKAWEALIRIPWHQQPPLVGGRALLSISRYDYGSGKDAPVLSSTSRHEAVDFHRQQEWTPIILVGDDHAGGGSAGERAAMSW